MFAGQMQKMGRIKKEEPDKIKNVKAMKFLLNQFAIDHLKFQAEEWASVKINQIFQSEFDKSDVIYVEFSTMDDVIKVSSFVSRGE